MFGLLVGTFRGSYLFDDLDDLTGIRIDQNGAVVHVGVAIAGDVILGGYFVIGDALFRQDRATRKSLS
jgi:hypothetical protein